MPDSSKMVRLLVAFDKAVSWPDFEHVVEAALHFFEQHYNADRVSLTLEPPHEAVYIVYTHDLSIPKLGPGDVIHFDTDSLQFLKTQAEPILVSDLAKKPAPHNIDQRLLAGGIKSYLIVPLRVEEQIIGSLNFDARQVSAFSSDTRETIQYLSARLALALHHARLHDRLKEREAELRARENQISALLDSVPTPVFAKDKDSRYVLLNDAFLAFFGRERADMLGKTTAESWPQAEADLYIKQDEQLFQAGGLQTFSAQLLNAAGETRDVQVRKAIYLDGSGQVAGLIGSLQDYTDLKAARDRYQQLFSASPDPLVVHDGKHILANNQAALNFFEAEDPTRFTDHPLASFIHPDSLKSSTKRIADLFSTGKPNRAVHQKFLTANGEVRDVEVNAIAIDYEGQRAIMSSFRDITEAKRIQDKLRFSEQNYRHLIEAIPNPVVVHEKGLVLYANMAALDFFGVAPIDDFLDKDIFRFVHPASRASAIKHAQEISRSGRPSPAGEQRYLNAAGETRVVKSRGIPIVFKGRQAVLVSFRDTTQEKAIQNELVAGQELYRRTFDFSPTAMVLHDRGQVVDANYAALDFGGFKTLAELQQYDLYQFIHPDYVEIARQGVEDLLKTGKAGSLREQIYITRLGEERWVNAIGVPVHNQNKDLVLVSFNDIHERVMGRKALEESRHQLELITDHVTLFIALLDLDMIIRYGNQATANWLNTDKEALYGLSLKSLLYHDAHKLFSKYFQQARQGKTVSFSYSYTPKEGKSITFWNTLIPVLGNDGKPQAVLCETEDVTEREAARRELAENQELLELIIDTIPGEFAYLDANERYLYVNQAYASFVGYPKAQLPGMTFEQVLSAETRAFTQPYLDKMFRGVDQQYSRWVTTRDGVNRALDVRYIAHFDQQGQVKAFLTSIQDITQVEQQAYHERALRQLASDLTREMDLHAAASLAAGAIRDVFKSDALTVEIYDHESQTALGVYSEDTFQGESAPREVGTRDIPFSDLDAQWVGFSFNAFCINRSIEDLPKAKQTVPFGDNRPSRSLLFVPLRWEGQNIGTVSIQSYTPYRYSEADLDLLQLFVDQIGGALIRGRKEAQIHLQQQALEKEKGKYQSIIENAGDALFVCSLKGNIQTVNQHACASLGYTEAELAHMNLRTIDPSFFKLFNTRQRQQLKETGGSLTLESTHLRQDGHTFPVELRISLTEIDQQPTILCFARDIAERRRATVRELALRTLAHDLNEATTMVSVGRLAAPSIRSFFDSDAFAIEYFEAERELILGVYSEDTFQGSNKPREVPSSDTPFDQVRVDFFKVSAQAHIRNRRPAELKKLKNTRPFGSSRLSHSLLFAPIKRKHQAVGILTVQSYTDQKYTKADLPDIQTFADQIGSALLRTRNDEELQRKKNELLESEAKYRSMIENAGDALLVTSLKGKILAFNRNATASLGYTEKALLHQPLDLICPTFKQLLPRKKINALIRLKQSATVEAVHRRQNGQEFPVELRVGTMEIQGQPCVLYFARDITERKEHEVFQRALQTLARKLTVRLKPFDVGVIAAKVLARLFAHDVFALYRLSADRLTAFMLYSEDIHPGDPAPQEDTIPGFKKDINLLDHRQVFIIPKPLLIHRQSKQSGPQLELTGNRRRRAKSLVFVPIFFERIQIGIFSIQSYKANQYTESDLKKLKILADQIGVALSRSQTDLELQNRQEQLTASVKEKEVLLKEVYHRTKNNMQVIIGLLDLNTYKTKHPETLAVLQEMTGRIYSMSLVHDLLYRSQSLAEIQLNTYLDRLVAQLLEAYQTSSGEIELSLIADPLPINIQLAVPLGLVINEIVSNILKYAFPDNQAGQISISALRYGQAGLRIIIEDNGVGLNEDFDLNTSNSLGMRIISEIVELQLFGSIKFISAQGLKYHITVPSLALETNMINGQNP